MGSPSYQKWPTDSMKNDTPVSSRLRNGRGDRLLVIGRSDGLADVARASREAPDQVHEMQILDERVHLEHVVAEETVVAGRLDVSTDEVVNRAGPATERQIAHPGANEVDRLGRKEELHRQDRVEALDVQ